MPGKDGLEVSWRGIHVLHVPETDLLRGVDHAYSGQPFPALNGPGQLDIVLSDFGQDSGFSGIARSAVISREGQVVFIHVLRLAGRARFGPRVDSRELRFTR